MKHILLSIAMAGGILFSAVSYAQTTPNGITNASTIFTNSDGSSLSTGPETIATAADNGNNDLLVYPNPVESSTRVVLDQIPYSNVFINIIDMNGQVVRTFEYGPGTYQLDVDMTNLPTGLYSVRVSGKDAGYHNLEVVKE